MTTACEMSPSYKEAPPNSGLLVAPKTYGVGVFAAQSFGTGERLAVFDAEFVAEATKYTIQVDEGRHLVTEGNLGAFLNHSCEPNSLFVAEKLEIVALKPLEVGDEVTFNYLTSEWDMASPFQCQCGFQSCHGYIRGFRHLSSDQKMRLSRLALPYLLALKKFDY